jgi:hypothetical protein
MEVRMLQWLLRRFVRRPIVWQRSIVELRELEALARTGLAGMLLAQEKARLGFVSARETHQLNPSVASTERLHESLMQLQATNAVVQSLLNEQQLERLLAAEQPAVETPVGKSR